MRVRSKHYLVSPSPSKRRQEKKITLKIEVQAEKRNNKYPRTNHIETKDDEKRGSEV